MPPTYSAVYGRNMSARPVTSSPTASGRVGLTSKPSIVFPAFSRPARSGWIAVSSRCSAEGKISRAPSAISPVCSRFLGPIAAM
ncbi:hypothetical protein M2436_001267 [Streptomyces sp. HB372]|nr:hypothetical protein [Streptomyces sp. HB372]